MSFVSPSDLEQPPPLAASFRHTPLEDRGPGPPTRDLAHTSLGSWPWSNWERCRGPTDDEFREAVAVVLIQ
eukprot:4886098-Pyramimonas_sp.AAC.1